MTYASQSVPYDQISYTGFGGQPRAIRVGYSNLGSRLGGGYSLGTEHTLFPELHGTSSADSPLDVPVVSYVEFPNNTRYEFYYNSYSELARVVLPTGGAVEYKYQEESGVIGNLPKQKIYRRVIERRVYEDKNSSTYTLKEQFGVPVYSPSTVRELRTQTIMVDRLNSSGTLLQRTKHYFHGSAFDSLLNYEEKAYAPWNEGLEYQTDAFASDGATVLRSVKNTWQPRVLRQWAADDPRVTETETAVEPAAANLVSKRTFAYSNDMHNNQTDIWEYDFGAGAAPPYPIRHTHTDYLTVHPTSGVNYADPASGIYYSAADIHIRKLMSASQVYSINPTDGTQTLAAQSEAVYDETGYPLLPCGTEAAPSPCSSAPHWDDPGATPRGNPTTQRRWTGSTWLETHAQYDQLGNLRKGWDANGNISSVTYVDSFSDGLPRNTYAYPTAATTAAPNPTAVHDPTGGPDFAAGTFGSTAGFTSYTSYDFNSGLATSTTDANGKTTAYDYTDPLNRLKRVDLPDGGRTTYNYVDAHQCGAYVEARTLLDTAGRELPSWQFYDGLGRPYLSEKGEYQEDGAPFLRVDTRYDALGRVSQVSSPYRTSGCTATPAGQWTTTEYDALGRPRKVTTPDGAKLYTLYDGARTLVTDQAGKQRVGKSDSLGRLTEVWEVRSPDAPTGTESVSFPIPQELAPDIPPVSAGYRTTYTYDVLGNLRQVAQGAQTRTFLYDSLSRLTSASNPESGTASYTYDPNGNLQTRTDARGVQTTYTYDGLNRNIIVHYAGGGTSTPDVRRYYDKSEAGTNGLERPWWSEKVGVSANVFDGYDAVGRPVRYHQLYWTGNPYWGQPFNVSVAYDKAGNVTSQTYPSGHTVKYNYDASGRVGDNPAQQTPQAFTGNLGDGVGRAYADKVRYGVFGGIEQERFGMQTPLYRKQHYNQRGQLFDIRLSTASWAADQWDWNRGAIINYYGGNYAWEGNPATPASADNNGNLRRSEVYVPLDPAGAYNAGAIGAYYTAQQTYSYDALNRLASVTEAHYDSQAVNQAPQFTQAYRYDRWGNRTVDLTQSAAAPVAQYDFERGDLQNTNRLYAPGDLAYPEPDNQNRKMRYDAAGNLIHDAHTGAGGRMYDAENRMVSAYDFSGNLAVYTYDSNGQRVKRNIGGEEWWQVYGMGGELLAEYRAGAATFLPSKEYGYRGGEMLVTISSGDTDRLRRFVKNLYYNALSRDPSAGELQQKMDELAQSGAQGGESQLLAKARQIARGLFESGEYVQRNRTDAQYVTDLYNSYLQRGPDQGGLNFWISNTQSNGRGATLNAFEVSTEFATLSATVYGTTAGGENHRVETFVRNFYYGALQREPTTDEMQSKTQRLNNAAAISQSQVIAEARAIGTEIIQSTGYNSSHTTEQYVTDLYEAFLQRAPDGPGLNFWVTNTQNNGRAATLEAFKASTEYRELAGTLYREAFWLVADQLGTPRMVVDKTGSLAGVTRHDYLPFGEEIGAGVSGRTTNQGYSPQGSLQSDGVRQQMAGSERDTETALDFMQARYYSGAQGRFTSADPYNVIHEQQYAEDDRKANAILKRYLLQPMRWNRYVYALNNPLRYVDPTGERDEEIVVRMNIVYDKSTISSEEAARKLTASAVADAQKVYATAGIKLEVSYTAGAATGGGVVQDGNKITEGKIEGAVNIFVSKNRAEYTGGISNYNTRETFINYGSDHSGTPRDPGDDIITHELGHQFGVVSKASWFGSIGDNYNNWTDDSIINDTNDSLRQGKTTELVMPVNMMGGLDNSGARASYRQIPTIAVYREHARRFAKK